MSALSPCRVCQEPTEMRCSDCAIDGCTDGVVCVKTTCRDAHESLWHRRPDIGATIDEGIGAVLDGRRSWTVAIGDCIDVLHAMPDACVDSVVTDPPYGLSEEPDIIKVMTAWLSGERYEHGFRGFMGKSWDSFVPGPECWREVFRVLKPGGHLLSFAGTRTWDLMSIAIRLAGFENRDTIRVDGPPAMGWRYGQGFAKGLDVAKAIDGKDGEWEGWNTNLKPSWEPILLFRKPVSEKTVAANVLRHGTGALNVDACRVSFTGEADEREAKDKNQHTAHGNSERVNQHGVFAEDGGPREDYDPDGRWPPNSLLVHDPRCERVGTKRVRTGTGIEPDSDGRNAGWFGSNGNLKHLGREIGYADSDGKEAVDDWQCVPECPATVLDGQSGSSATRPGSPRSSSRPGNGWGSTHTGAEYHDAGGASRFLPQFQVEAAEDPFLYTAKAPAREKMFLCRDCRDAFPVSQESRHAHGHRNREHLIRHPTQKPIAIMKWLVTLATPKGGLVLDPFAGTGSTGVAATRAGFHFVGVELDGEYAEIARRRMEDDAPLLAFAERPKSTNPSESTSPPEEGDTE